MKDKVVVITGSTSGIGFEIAKHFAKLGTKLVINDFAKDDEVKKISMELKNLGAANVFYQGVNLEKPSEIKAMFENIVKEFGKIDILVNNAGIQHVAPIDEFPEDKWEQILRIDLIASFYTTKYSIPIMKKNGFGRIVNIASAHAYVASPFKSAYVAAKHGILGLTKTVALEVAENNITVNAVCPGYVNTPLVKNQIADTAKARHISEESTLRDVILKSQATKKFVEASEIADLVIFLCDEKVSSITGAGLFIDGGWTAQ
ncbi:3-hydroxybutyrate dehydrogenase [Rickettsia endosymbiont of Pantilius tunicatus]|uniref:3-hydroxybutyrate dehydrogenase n=1 Tax=Rickettsia endosymbiont of Pantilius tunicatus TaxID=3066267 RepID=UPI0030E4AE4E